MTNILRWGLLSTARINQALIPMLRASRRSQLVAVASRNPDAAHAYARQWKIARAHGSYEALLEDDEVDVIYNPLPNALHAEWTIRALGLGKHVLCEKPLAMSVAEVDAMEAAARQSGKVLAEALMYRHHPQTRRVKEMVDAGTLGKLQVIKGALSFNLQRQGDVRLIPELGGGSIWDVGIYPISYARLLAGSEPLEVTGWQVVGETGVDLTFAGQLRFPGDVMAQFDCGFRTAGRGYVEIAGTDAWMRIEAPFKPGLDERLEIHGSDGVKRSIVRGEQLYMGEVRDMEDSVLKGEAPRVTLADSRGTIAVISALLESAREGRPVSFAGKGKGT